jgi:hypothetical protein
MEVPFVKKNRDGEGLPGAADKKKRRLSNGFSLLTPSKWRDEMHAARASGR